MSKSVQSRSKVGPKSVQSQPKAGPKLSKSQPKVGQKATPSHPPLVPDPLVQKLHPPRSLSDALDPPPLVIHGGILSVRCRVNTDFGNSKTKGPGKGCSALALGDDDSSIHRPLGGAYVLVSEGLQLLPMLVWKSGRGCRSGATPCGNARRSLTNSTGGAHKRAIFDLFVRFGAAGPIPKARKWPRHA